MCVCVIVSIYVTTQSHQEKHEGEPWQLLEGGAASRVDTAAVKAERVCVCVCVRVSACLCVLDIESWGQAMDGMSDVCPDARQQRRKRGQAVMS